MTPCCRHFDVPIAFLHAHKSTIYTPHLVTTDKMMADIGTKPNTPTVFKRFKYWITGERFLPKKGHEHYELLQMMFYEKEYHVILKLIKDMNESSNT